MNRRRVAVVLVAVACLIIAACGQKSGVHLASGASGSGANAFGAGDAGSTTGATDATGAAAGSGGATGGPATGTAGSASGTSGGATTGAGGSAGTGGPAAGGPAAGGTQAAPTGAAGPGDTTGVTDDTITIGIHAPATGAGAPAPSFDMGKAVYFNSIGKAINGRQVKVDFEDDGYNPSQAVAACKKLVEQDHVFLLVGGGGTDQIVACAQYANSVGVPYLAEGVTEKNLSTLKGYFAESLTYRAQGVLLAQYIKNVLHMTDVVVVVGNTPNFQDGHQGFVDAAKQLGLNVKKDISINKDASQSEAATAAQQACSAATTPTDTSKLVVYPLMSPAVFINFATAAAQQQCFPRYAGVGITLGLNIVAQALCPSQALKTGASFFSPYQGLDAAEPAYQQAYQAQNHQAGDDIGYGLWGAEKLLAAELGAPGRALSRQSFVAALRGKQFSTGVYPPLNYAQGPFGGTATHVLIANCGKNAYDTQFQNKSGF